MFFFVVVVVTQLKYLGEENVNKFLLRLTVYNLWYSSILQFYFTLDTIEPCAIKTQEKVISLSQITNNLNVIVNPMSRSYK